MGTFRSRWQSNNSRTTTDEKSALLTGDHVTLRRRRLPTPPIIDVEAVANVVSPLTATAVETERPPSVASSVDTGRRKLPTIKLGTYDGSTALETFLAKFDNCAAYNSWSKRDQLFHLKVSLQGYASQILSKVTAESTELDVIKLLWNRFGSINHGKQVGIKLRKKAEGAAATAVESVLCEPPRASPYGLDPSSSYPTTSSLTSEWINENASAPMSATIQHVEPSLVGLLLLILDRVFQKHV